MAFTEITVTTQQSLITKNGIVDWATAISDDPHGDGTMNQDGTPFHLQALGIGGNKYKCARNFLKFDTSALVGDMLSVTLNMTAHVTQWAGTSGTKLYVNKTDAWNNDPPTDATDWALTVGGVLTDVSGGGFSLTGVNVNDPIEVPLSASAVTVGDMTYLQLRNSLDQEATEPVNTNYRFAASPVPFLNITMAGPAGPMSGDITVGNAMTADISVANAMTADVSVSNAMTASISVQDET